MTDDAAVTEPTAESLVELFARRWWVVLIRGVLLIALGLYAVISPGMTLVTFSYVLGAFLAADGVLSILLAIFAPVRSRVWKAVRGVIVLLIGLAIMASPALFGAIAALTLIYIIAAGLIIGGVLDIVIAIRERKAIEGEGWIVLNGVLTVVLGLALTLAPLFAAAALIVMAGIVAIVVGIGAVAMSLRLRRLRDAFDHASHHPTEPSETPISADPAT